MTSATHFCNVCCMFLIFSWAIALLSKKACSYSLILSKDKAACKVKSIAWTWRIVCNRVFKFVNKSLDCCSCIGSTNSSSFQIDELWKFHSVLCDTIEMLFNIKDIYFASKIIDFWGGVFTRYVIHYLITLYPRLSFRACNGIESVIYTCNTSDWNHVNIKIHMTWPLFDHYIFWK